MLLHKLNLNLRSREARRDIANPYELHSTLCRAFSTPNIKCSAGSFLWRLESSKDCNAHPVVLVQSCKNPDWTRIGVNDWFETIPNIPVDLAAQLSIDSLKAGQKFRYRLRANPCASIQGKRQGLFQNSDQLKWLARKGVLHGFKLPYLSSFALDEMEGFDVMISQEEMIKGQQRNGNVIKIFSVQYDGILTVTDVDKFLFALKFGIGHGKALGLGLLSVVPIV